MNSTSILILPGWQNSGPAHWQTLWQEQNPGFRRIEQRDWETPQLGDWLQEIGGAVTASPPPVVLVAHSLGCVAVAHWMQMASGCAGLVKGALLVAPADVDRYDTPWQLRNFSPVPMSPLPFPSITVASNNDPYLSADRARAFAAAWGSQFFDIGAAGHINGDSGLGDWPEGKRLLRMLME